MAEEEEMDTWSNTSRKCDMCGLRYAPRKNVSYKHKDFCSFKCKEDFIDAESHVNGAYVPPDGSGEDNPNTLFDWAERHVTR